MTLLQNTKASAPTGPVSSNPSTHSGAAPARKPAVDLDQMMTDWRAIAGDISHLSPREKGLHLELRQAHYALQSAQKTHVAYQAQTEAQMRRLREDNAMLRAMVCDAGHFTASDKQPSAPSAMSRT